MSRVTYFRDPAGHVYRADQAPAANNLEKVVVIDPEDREQVEWLWSAQDRAIPLIREQQGPGIVGVSLIDALQVGLRMMLDPSGIPALPKPDEPTGLGAVVEDTDGVRWTRVEPGGVNYTRNPWYPADDADKQPAEYADIAAVRVLSGGVA